MNGKTTQWVRFDWPLSGQNFKLCVPEGYCLCEGRGEHLEAMQALIVKAYASDPSWEGQTGDIVRRVGDRMRKRISDPTAYFALALFDGRVIGLNGVALQSPTNMNLITGICVDPEHQGRGLGSFLLGHSLIWLRDQGLPLATVTTDTAAVAARVYNRFGAVKTPNVINTDPPKQS